MSNIKQSVTARQLNCEAELGTVSRCPYCGQFHLRPGYCQALDTINAGKEWKLRDKYYPEVAGRDPTSYTATVTKAGLVVTDNSEVGLRPVDEEHVTDNGHVAICQECGKEFPSKRSDAKFCSATCRKFASRKPDDGGVDE